MSKGMDKSTDRSNVVDKSIGNVVWREATGGAPGAGIFTNTKGNNAKILGLRKLLLGFCVCGVGV